MAVGMGKPARKKKCALDAHELVMPNVSDSLHDIRVFTSESMADLPLSSRSVWDVVLAVAEAATNCVVHGQARGRRNTITTRIFADPDAVRIEMQDAGGANFRPDMEAWPPPNLTSERGRGIFIMKTLMDGVEYLPAKKGTLCVLTKKFDCGK